MSPEDDQLQHPSGRLANHEVEMPAVSRGWNPIAQSDDHQPPPASTNNTNNSASPKKPTVNGNGNGVLLSPLSSLLPSSETTSSSNIIIIAPKNAATVISNGNGIAAALSQQNGNQLNANGSALQAAPTTTKNGTAMVQLPMTITTPSANTITLNGNGTALHNNSHPQHHPSTKSNMISNTNSTAADSAGATNNNDVWSMSPALAAAQSATTSPARIEKNGWKELPQEEQDEHHTVHRNGTSNGSNGNNTGTSATGGGLGGSTTPSNGGNAAAATVLGATASSLGTVEKLHTAEDDPLTGVICKDIDPDELSTCGIGACQPKWARMFATTKSFMCVFLIAWVLQGMYFTYVVSVITTIEKLFQIKSKTSGMLLSATEVGQIGTALLLTYFAGQGHRPRWIACGMVLFAVSAFGCSIPHFMYGSELLHANNALYGGRGVSTAGVSGAEPRGPYSDALRVQSTTATASSKLDDLADRVLPVLAAAEAAATAAAAAQNNSDLYHSSSSSSGGGFEYNLCRANGNGTSTFDGACKTEQLEEQAQHSQITYTVLVMLVICMLGVGIGQTAVATLGIPFIDDNVASRESAIYIGALVCQPYSPDRNLNQIIGGWFINCVELLSGFCDARSYYDWSTHFGTDKRFYAGLGLYTAARRLDGSGLRSR